MKRDLNKLSENKHDILIIGGGIYGATLLWSASVAGYSAALIEQNDFASGTSANSQKIIHGGLRYLQNLDFLRIRQSVSERKRLMWLAPHLVSPLPCIMPLYGYKLKGKESLSCAIKLYNLISADRNNLPDRSKYIPNGKILNKKKINDLLPGIEQKNLRGGVLWFDAFCNNTERLIISFIKSAVNIGCSAANYVKAEKLIIDNNDVKGVEVFDKLSQNHFQIKAEKVIACTGSDLIDLNEKLNIPKQKYVAGINVVVKRMFPHNYAAGIENPENNRLYFVAPWKDKTILGTDWYPAPEPENFVFKKIHVRKLLNNFNETFPQANLTYDDVEFVHKGFVPAADNFENSNSTLSHFRIINGAKSGINGFYKLVGVKYTTALNVADTLLRTINPGFKKMSIKSQPKLIGGEIVNLNEFKNKTHEKYQAFYSNQEIDSLVYNYGSEISNVLSHLNSSAENIEKKDKYYELLRAKVIFAIEDEMALHLDDVILRRTDIGSSGLPDDKELDFTLKIMAEELDWDETKRFEEIQKVESYYSLLNKNLVYKQNLVLT